MKKMLSKIKQSKVGKLGAVLFAAVSTACMGCINAFAASNIDESMKTALGTAFTTVKEDAVSLMVIALPAALSIMGIVIAIKLGIKFFKKFSN